MGLFYTGGTTGRAKGVMLSHKNLAANALHVIIEFRYTSDMNYLHAAPMFHLADMASTFAVTMLGGCHTIRRGIAEPGTVWERRLASAGQSDVGVDGAGRE